MRIAFLLLLGALAACAPSSTYRPTVDLTGFGPARYETDLRDCKKVAERDRFGPLAVGLLQGAALGAALGAVGGAIAGGNVGLATSYGALSGTVVGGAVGATQIGEPVDETAVVDQCLRNNGYVISDPPK
jgi:hypothetical protein